eukprot:2588270-Rhodomonas_salina.2
MPIVLLPFLLRQSRRRTRETGSRPPRVVDVVECSMPNALVVERSGSRAVCLQSARFRLRREDTRHCRALRLLRSSSRLVLSLRWLCRQKRADQRQHSLRRVLCAQPKVRNGVEPFAGLC